MQDEGVGPNSSITGSPHRSKGTSSDQRTTAGQAAEEMKMLNRIASQALGFARVSDSAKPINLVDLAEAALRIHERTIAAKKIHLVKDLRGDVIAEVKHSQMLQVVSNLLHNALDALPDGGTLFLRVRKRTDRVEFLVADNGQGIASEHVQQIFEPFFTTKKRPATALVSLRRKGLLRTIKARSRFGAVCDQRDRVLS